MDKYWAERTAKTQEKLTTKSIKDTERQLIKYYTKARNKVVEDFCSTYEKLLLSVGADKQPTPADLYKLDKYWQMQSQITEQLNALGDKQARLFSKQFKKQFMGIYESLSMDSAVEFSTLSKETVNQMVNAIWCADGKSWSQRVWDNTEKLQEVLNDNLLNCVLTGKKPSELKKILQEDFGVSYRRADTVVRTEIAHIQTVAANERYKNYGIQKYEVLVDVDKRTCDKCKSMNGKQFLMSEMIVGVNAPPFHPNDRCCIIPVVE